MRRLSLVALVLIAAFTVASFKGYAADLQEKEVEVYLGEVKIIPADKPTRIAISKPEIADIKEVTTTSIAINPRAAGVTTLVFWDNSGENSCKVIVLTEDLSETKLRVDNILNKLGFKKVYASAEEKEGKIFLFGRVTSSKEREKILTALGSLTDKVLDLIEVREDETMVDIEVQVLELSKDATETLGFSMPGSVNVAEPSTRFSKVLRGSFDAIAHIFDWPRNEFSATIDFLVQEGKARILSRPHLACLSGKEAELLVGGEKPIITTEVIEFGGSEGTNVEYKEYGIKLKIKPTVNKENRIHLALNVEVSDVGTAETIGSATTTTARAYPLSKRSASTELILDDGQVMVIGGLKKVKIEEDYRKTPFLGDIPIIGWLFKRKQTKRGGGTGERGDTELFIMLTPTLLKTDDGMIPPKKEEAPKKAAEPKPEPEVAAVKKDLPPPESYMKAVRRKILKNLSYPLRAKKSGAEGTVKLSLRISRKGKLLEAKVTSSSGYKVLDRNTLSAAKSVASYPRFPRSVKQKELQVDIPIVYQLNGKKEVKIPSEKAVRRYSEIIKKRILKNLKYPDSAKKTNAQGTVKLSLHLSHTGSVLDAAVKSSSGSKELDDHSVAVAKRISSYPPFPPSIQQNELWIDVPIVYRLN
ncbi:TonB family protein [Candidatus Omnitrophota bacterium]